MTASRRHPQCRVGNTELDYHLGGRSRRSTGTAAGRRPEFSDTRVRAATNKGLRSQFLNPAQSKVDT
jgi:hypothetical protein